MIKKKAVAGGIVALAAVLGGGGIFAWTCRIEDTETLADNQKYCICLCDQHRGK